MRIVSLLPSATEIVYALGLGDQLAAVTSSCDFPPEAAEKPVVSRPVLDDGDMAPADLDRAVAERAAAGQSMYDLDVDAIREIDPHLILTQDLCQVCAVPSGQVDEALQRLGCEATVVSLDPHTLTDVVDDIVRVARATGREDRGAEVAAELRARIEVVRAAVAARPRVRTMALEWLDPAFTAGHWVPDMIAAGGGEALLAEPGAPSRRVSWKDVGASQPDAIVAIPCGYRLEQARTEAASLYERPELAGTPAVSSERVLAGDADGLFSRPGPRLVAGLEALAWALHPDAVARPPAGAIAAVGKLT